MVWGDAQGEGRGRRLLVVTVASDNKAEQCAHCQGSGPSFTPSLITITVCATDENQAANDSAFCAQISIQLLQWTFVHFTELYDENQSNFRDGSLKTLNNS